MTGWGQIYFCAHNSNTPWWNVLNFYQPIQNTLAVLVQSLCLKKQISFPSVSHEGTMDRSCENFFKSLSLARQLVYPFLASP